MTMKQFIKENRTEIDATIRASSENARIDDNERRLWILNDYSLYTWARSCGVKI